MTEDGRQTTEKRLLIKSFGRSRNPFSKGFLAAGGKSWRWIREPVPGNNLEEVIPAGTAVVPGIFTNTFQKFAKQTSFLFVPDVFTTSAAAFLSGCGSRPLFEKIIFQQRGFLSYFLSSKVLNFGYTELLFLIFDFCPCRPKSAAAHTIKHFNKWRTP